MSREYTREEIIQWLKDYFTQEGYEVMRYSDEFLPVRVPLYGRSSSDQKPDVAVDFTLSSVLSKDTFLPPMTIDKVKIYEASPLCFYQYYFIQAHVYLAYPNYVKKNRDFYEFKKVCETRGIGLLAVSEEVKEVSKPRPLFDVICDETNIKQNMRKRLEYFLRNFLHYFVYFPKPEFKRRSITGRTEGNISLVLIEKLGELKKISYASCLTDLASEYYQEARGDYQIALDTIKRLWQEVCGVEYPEVQRQLEDILLRNPEYRDHFLHQFQVFLLGAYIIDKLYGNNEKCIREYNKNYNCSIEEAWLLASTYHDFNYSIQRYDLWSKEFFSQALNTKCKLSDLKLDTAFIRENFLLKTRDLCDALSLKMDHGVTNFFFEEAVTERNHGLLSALSMLKLLENSNGKKISREGQIQVAVAIALHDYNIWAAFANLKDGNLPLWYENFAKEEHLKNLEFIKHPLVFLLIFCDTVQEWGRVGKNYQESKPRLEDVVIEPTKVKVALSLKDDADVSYGQKDSEIGQVKKFLKDGRFIITLRSRIGGSSSEREMQGM